MDSDIISSMLREESDLVRKLDAVRALLRAYGKEGTIAAPWPKTDQSVTRQNTTKSRSSKPNEKLPIDRFSVYGKSIVAAAIDECRSHVSSPIPSREMVSLIEAKGIEVRGKDKANAISALLARSVDLMPNGRKGWTLSDEFLATSGLNENEPPLGGSDTGDSPSAAKRVDSLMSSTSLSTGTDPARFVGREGG